MPVAILHPFSGIAGDMTLGALVGVGLDPDWLRALPRRLALDDVTVDIRDVKRAGIACTDRKSTRLNSSHIQKSRMPSSA